MSDDERLDLDDLDLRVTLLERAVERLEARLAMRAGSMNTEPGTDSAPATFDPPID
jgi:uncharacterized small protein (DUF1192 family)